MLVEVRRCIHHWLRSSAWPAAAIAEIECAVSEAATNVVEHAYPAGRRPGLIQLYAWTYRELFAPRHERVVLTITDTGRWPDRSTAPSYEHLGYGFSIISAFTHEHYIRSSGDGTQVVLVSHARPGDAAA
jgi:anti-sigma regulatory factor (Ser/Thr protein kinase)